MPVVAVIAAVGADAFAVSTGFATLATIAAVGATTAAIGAVTGNKTLELVGGAIGIVGAVGTLALGSGALGSVGDLFGSSASDTSAATASLTAADNAGAVQIGNALDSAAPGAAGTSDSIVGATGAINSISPNVALQASNAASEGNAAAIETAGQQPGSVLNQALTTTPVSNTMPTNMQTDTTAQTSGAGGATGAGIALPGLPSPNMSPAVSAELANNPNPGITAAPAAGDMTTAQALLAMNSSNNKNLLTMGLLQAGGSLISGLTNPMTPAQISALNAQANANNAAAALTQQQTANMAQPLPTASVTGAPASPGGLINNKPVASPLITGYQNTAAPATQVSGAIS